MDIDKRFSSKTATLVFFFFLLLIALGPACRSRKARSASVKNGAVEHKAPATSKFDENDAADKIESLMGGLVIEDSVWTAGKVYDIHTAMQKAYTDEDYFPIWLTENGDTSYIALLIEDLKTLKFDGLGKERYHIDDLQKRLKQYCAAKNVSADEVIALDTLCTRSYLQASRDLLLGVVIPKDVDTLWFHANDSVWKPYNALANMGRGDADYPMLDSFRSIIPTYRLLRKAVMKYDTLLTDSNYTKAKQAIAEGHATDSIKDVVMAMELPWALSTDTGDIITHSKYTSAYQYFIGAKNYSKKDSLTKAYMAYPIDTLIERAALNMERLRWMQQDLEQKYVLVNVPLMELFLRIDGEDSMHMEVVVGKTIRQTPSLNANMANVVINPPWGVPPTIMKKDVLPGMAKSGKAYLRKKGLKVYDFKGQQVDAAVVTANNYKRYVFRQDPGDDNSLGYVKFNLPNKWDIYLHDTPHREDFGKKDRFQSSGCIRVQKPKELAEFILSTLEGRRYPISRIDSVIETKKTRYEVLKNRIPVHVVYLTAFEDSTKQQFRFIYDMYKRDGRLKAALSN